MPKNSPVLSKMNPSDPSPSSELTIVGGGITGLALAYLSARAGARVRVIEKGSHFGGLLRTFDVGGNKLEFYYHHFFNHDAEINWLIQELGLEDKLIFRNSTMGVFRDGKIYDFNTPLDLLAFRPMNFLDKFRFGLTSLFLGKMANWRKFEDIPARKWLEKWAGKSSTTSLWNPMLNIKFGPYAEQVPLSWMIGRLKQRLGSRNSGGKEELGYLKGSLQVLLDALLAKLEELGVELIADNALEGVEIKENSLKAICTQKGRIEGGDFVFTLPGVYLKDLLQAGAPDLAHKLSEIRYFGALCLLLETDKALSHIYWLNIADPGFPFGGIIEHTNFIPPSNYGGKHLTYLSRYFAPEDPLAQMSREEVMELMLPALERIYPGFRREDIQKVHLFKTMTAATVCDLGFSEKVPNGKSEIEHLFLANMAHIYPDERSTNNSIRVAAELSKVLGWGEYAEKIPYGSSLSGKIGLVSG